MKLPAGFKVSRFRVPCPHLRKVKSSYYRCFLIVCGAGIWVVHSVVPHYEMHAMFVTHVLVCFESVLTAGGEAVAA